MSAATVRLTRTADPLGPDDFVAHPSGRLLQVCRATVGMADATQRVALVLPADADAAAIMLDSLGAILAEESVGTIVALLRETGEGWATVEVSRQHETRSLSVAAAAAVMQASWGWDESRTIVVAVNGIPIAVEPRFTGESWTVGVATPAV